MLGRVASGGALDPQPPRATRSQPESIGTVLHSFFFIFWCARFFVCQVVCFLCVPGFSVCWDARKKKWVEPAQLKLQKIIGWIRLQKPAGSDLGSFLMIFLMIFWMFCSMKILIFSVKILDFLYEKS